jgi:tol-pal system protein YbgF
LGADAWFFNNLLFFIKLSTCYGNTKMKPAIYAILIAVSLLLLTGCASVADIKSLERRISSVEAENINLKTRIQDLTTDMDQQRELYANQDAELYKFKEEFQKLNGRLDETEYKFNQEKQAMNNSMQSFRDAFSRTSGLPPEQSGQPPQQPDLTSGAVPDTAATTASLPPPPVADDVSEEELYRLAKDAYDQKNFTAARQYFERFLEKYPKSNIADNARFWIGETYFSEGWFQKAILEYQEVIEKYPKGNKVPAAYLKQGISFFKLGENANAKLVLNELIKRFPESSEADSARQHIKQIP